MPKLQSQQDIVSQFLAKEKIDEEFVDELCIPGLASRFAEFPKGAKIKTKALRFPGLKALGGKPRRDIAEVLSGVVECRKDIVGFKWVIGEDSITISYVEGFQQKMPKTDADRDRLLSLFLTVLKSRRNILSIKWVFGRDHIVVRYLD